jgi:hypothetical protein
VHLLPKLGGCNFRTDVASISTTIVSTSAGTFASTLHLGISWYARFFLPISSSSPIHPFALGSKHRSCQIDDFFTCFILLGILIHRQARTSFPSCLLQLLVPSLLGTTEFWPACMSIIAVGSWPLL